MPAFPPIDVNFQALERWEAEFRRAAEADALDLFRDHLERLELRDEPELLYRGTVLAVSACCIYAAMDSRAVEEFLAAQTYDPAQAPPGLYAFTFDLVGKGYARVLAPTDGGLLDLADLYDHGWPPYETCGYTRIWISRADGQDLTPAEEDALTAAVTADLRFDYAEDELWFWVNSGVVEGALEVHFYEPEPGETLDDDLGP